jgi:hypothetical protein
VSRLVRKRFVGSERSCAQVTSRKGHTLTKAQLRTERPDWKALLTDNANLTRESVHAAPQKILEVEITGASAGRTR